MAVEQDWTAYGDQGHLKTTDTLLARTAGGAGVEIPGVNVLARRADNGNFIGIAPIELAPVGFFGELLFTGSGIANIRSYRFGQGIVGYSNSGISIRDTTNNLNIFELGGNSIGDLTLRPSANKEIRFVNAAHNTFASQTGAIVFTRSDGGQLQSIMGVENGALAVAAREGVIFATGGGATYSGTIEQARIDASGNFGLGVVPAVKMHVKGFNEIVRLETTQARGNGACAMYFRDPTGGKGYFGFASVFNDQLYLMNALNADMLLGTNNTDRWRIAGTGPLTPVADNAYSFGGASNRPTVLWAASGTISTSDARNKKWRGALTKAELKAATRIFKEIGLYQWNEAVEEKGDEARFHVGVRAQAVWAIMAEEKLVAPIGKSGRPGKTPYAFLCYDKWEAEYEPIMIEVEVEKTRTVQIVSKIIDPATGEGIVSEMQEAYIEVELQDSGKKRCVKEAGDRYSIREGQLLMFMMAAVAEKLEL